MVFCEAATVAILAKQGRLVSRFYVCVVASSADGRDDSEGDGGGVSTVGDVWGGKQHVRMMSFRQCLLLGK